jgi:toxin CptA
VLKIALRSSRLLAVIMALAHGAAIAVVVLVDIPVPVKAVAAAGLAGYWLVIVRRQSLLLTADSAVAIEISSDGNFSIQTRRGEWSECEVLGSTYVTPWLTVLNLRESEDRASRRIVILPDSVDAEDFRKLRLWLRWKEDVPTT